MYRVSGRSWVALGDPIGPRDQHEDLAWQFVELCDRYDAWPAFYEVPEGSLPTYIDMGLSLSKLGEEGLVPLVEFSLQGKHRADLRQARHRAERIGASFSVVPKERISDLIAELEAVSDDWLAHKGVAEKGFSLGRFSAEYIANFDCALVTVSDRIVAFANLWQAPAGREVSIDLMRYTDDAPSGIMDFLFGELLLWAKSHDYAWFNLGMSPLSGLEEHPLAPLWHHVGNLVFRHADDFYNFEGLRRYKEKFSPIWRARYLASPGGLVLPRVFLDSSILISGGLTKMVPR
jgi:phosphatidylglycerol lysyltransferase